MTRIAGFRYYGYPLNSMVDSTNDVALHSFANFRSYIQFIHSDLLISGTVCTSLCLDLTRSFEWRASTLGFVPRSQTFKFTPSRWRILAQDNTTLATSSRWALKENKIPHFLCSSSSLIHGFKAKSLDWIPRDSHSCVRVSSGQPQ